MYLLVFDVAQRNKYTNIYTYIYIDSCLCIFRPYISLWICCNKGVYVYLDVFASSNGIRMIYGTCIPLGFL